MADFSIIVEGEEDIRFLQDFIQFHFGKIVERNSFIDIGGKTETLQKSVAKIQSSTEKGNTNLLIFDADDEDYSSTLKKVAAKALELSLSIDTIFLLPNNEEQGNLETLLKSCIDPKNRQLLQCIKDFEICKRKLGLSNLRDIDAKGELHIYQGSFAGSGIAKATKRTYLDEQIWNLNCEQGVALKNLLKKFMS